MQHENNYRVLTLAKILFERTDENHPISTKELIDLLKLKYGIDTHRVTIYEDIQLLQQFGLDIYTIRSSQNKYFLASRLFDLPELKLLIDAVESSKFITAKKSKQLVEKIGLLASVNCADELKRHLAPDGRVKSSNERIFYIIDSIHKAINAKKKISFQYFHYNQQKERELSQNGEYYVFSPWMLVWNGDFYYMLGYSDKHEMINSFRVDRIAGHPITLDENAVPEPEDFDAAAHLNTMFRMFTGERKTVEVLCENDTMDPIIDRFGINVETTQQDEQHFVAKLEIVPNHVFFNWIFGFGGKVVIISPQETKNEYLQKLHEAAKEY